MDSNLNFNRTFFLRTMIALIKQGKSTFADSSIITMVIGLMVYYGRRTLDQAGSPGRSKSGQL